MIRVMCVNAVDSRFRRVHGRDKPRGHIPPVPIENNAGYSICCCRLVESIDRPVTWALAAILVGGVYDAGSSLDNDVFCAAVNVRA